MRDGCKRDGYTLQSSLMLSGTLYSNLKFTLDRKHFQIIKKKNEYLFFQCRHPYLADPTPQCPKLSAFSCPFPAPSPPVGADILYVWPLGTKMGLVGVESYNFQISFALLKKVLFNYLHYSIFMKIEVRFWKKIGPSSWQKIKIY